MTDDIAIEVPSADDWPALFRSSITAFNSDVEEELSDWERMLFEPERFLVARRDGEIVGTAGIYTRRLAVPGATVPAAHVTFVSVLPTARRQGVLTRFIERQFADIRDAGESIAVLWASEARIYQRFGYGSAARRLRLKVDTREVRLVAGTPGGRLREGTPADFRDTIAKLYDEVYEQRPGWSERGPQNVDYRLTDIKPLRNGASSLRVLVHEGDQGADGYALWRVTEDWNDSGPAGDVRVMEVCAATDEAYTAIWQFLLTVDLTRSASQFSAAVDEPLQFMVNEPRRLDARLSDALWLRIVDVPGALSARRYATEVDLVLDVSDGRITANEGRWRLTGSPGEARCASTMDEADLWCDVRALGSVYLGGTPWDALATAGLVRELRPGALALAATAFGWHRMPSAPEVF